MQLQIAIDVADMDEMMKMAEQIEDVIDIVEVGTPIIMKYGMEPVKALKKAYPEMTVLADTKIVDGGRLESGDACAAGADIITVLAMADNATSLDVVDTAHSCGRKVMADLIMVEEIEQRAGELVDMGVDYVCVHLGVDMQKNGRTVLGDLKRLVLAIPTSKAVAAGGITLDTVGTYAALEPAIIVAGSALYKAPDIRAAVQSMKEAMK